MFLRARSRHTARVAHVAESEVMGRAAIAVVVLCVQPTAVGQLAGWFQGSETLDQSGQPTALATVWAVTMLLGGAAMLASYVVPRFDDTRVLEMAASVAMGIVAAVHGYAIFSTIGYSGSSYVVGTDTALVINSLGLAYFRARQLRFVAAQKRAARSRA